jgi:PAS domain S-box-containing protein
MQDKNGNVTGIMGATRDITERRKAEEALQKSEARYRLLAENIKDVIWTIDMNLRLSYTSPSITQLTGYRHEEYVTKTLEEILTPASFEFVTNLFAEELALDDSGHSDLFRARTFEVELICKDGSSVPVEMKATALRDADGRPIGVLGVSRDITERKRAEEELRLLSDAVKMSQDSIVISDLEGRIVEANEATLKMHGMDNREDLIGRPALELIAPEDHEMLTEKMAKGMVSGELSCLEYHSVTKDGRKILVEANVSVMKDRNGEPIGYMAVVRDITERKRMEEEVRHLSDAVRMSAESIFVADLEGRVVDANEAAVKMFAAIDKLDLLGKGVLELIAPEDHEKALENIKRVLEGEKVTPKEYCIVRKDGSRNLSELSASVVIGGDGKPTGFVAVARDITERKRIEEALKQSEQDYRTLFDTTIDGMAVIDAETMRVLLINQPIVQKYGSGLLDDIFKGNLLDFVHPEDRERALKLIVEDLFEKDAREFVKIRLINSDGKVFWASCTGARITYQGRPAGLVSLRDITEQQEAENALRQSEQSYKVLLESTHDSILVVDAETFKVTFGNRRASMMFGFDPVLQDGIGVNLLDFIHPEDREIAIEGFVKDLYQAERRRRYDVRAKTQDGREIWVSALGTRIEFQGRIAVLLSLRDITKDKQMEEEKRKLEEQIQLTGRLAAVGELAAGVAHELNNPITAIKGYAQLLTKKKELDEPLRKDLETIYRESQRAARITQNLLSFARRHEPEKHLISINEAIEKTLELRAHPMKVNNIEVIVELDADLPKTLADFHQMQQVFVNIINNAEQAMTEAHGKGRLEVKTKKMRDMIQISFADDGPGIPEDNIKRIFDPFFTTKEVGKGTGLGLSICYGLVEAHGGRIYARSKLGQGATFVVEIPIVSEDRLVAEAALLNPGSRGVTWKKPREQY